MGKCAVGAYAGPQCHRAGTARRKGAAKAPDAQPGTARVRAATLVLAREPSPLYMATLETFDTAHNGEHKKLHCYLRK